MKSRFANKLMLAVAPRFASGVIRLLHALLKTETLGAAHVGQFWDKGEAVILSTWHDQLLMMINVYRGPGARILISRSNDGELIARIMQRFGQDAVRGSSSRGGRDAFKKLILLARKPYDLGITPDGPKGPRHQIKEGVVQLARMTGRPVVPLAFACSNGHRFNSWDRFLLPYPWGRGVYHFGAPQYFHKGESIDAFRTRIQQAMDDNTRKAQEHLRSHDLSPV